MNEVPPRPTSPAGDAAADPRIGVSPPGTRAVVEQPVGWFAEVEARLAAAEPAVCPDCYWPLHLPHHKCPARIPVEHWPRCERCGLRWRPMSYHQCPAILREPTAYDECPTHLHLRAEVFP